MRLTNQGEYMVDAFGVLLAPGASLEGEPCKTLLDAHPEIRNSIGRNGLELDPEGRAQAGISPSATVASEVTQGNSAPAEETAEADKPQAQPSRPQNGNGNQRR